MMITGMISFVLALTLIAAIFTFGVVGTVLGLVFRVTTFGVRIIVKPILSVLAILLLLFVFIL